ncbi:MAG: phosphodiesterase [Erysipelotrichaceae bacterium]|nr:phosphodiesterase [Erysipelotrichaceae bacterium]
MATKKWMVASDLHGSILYANKMIEAYKKEEADKLILLGDLLYHGPRNDLPVEYKPKEVIKVLNDNKEDILCVRGNCDAEVDQMVLEFPIVADYALLESEGIDIFATHGHVYNENKLPKMAKKFILLHGHTHVPKCVENENYIYMNPGSMTIPKEGSHHGYMLIEGNKFTWKDFDGNIINEYTYKG